MSISNNSEQPKARFLKKLAKLREKGLVNIKFFRNSNGADSTEDVYREINCMLESTKVAESDSL